MARPHWVTMAVGRASSHGGAVNLVRSGTKQPQPFSISAEGQARPPLIPASAISAASALPEAPDAVQAGESAQASSRSTPARFTISGFTVPASQARTTASMRASRTHQASLHTFPAAFAATCAPCRSMPCLPTMPAAGPAQPAKLRPDYSVWPATSCRTLILCLIAERCPEPGALRSGVRRSPDRQHVRTPERNQNRDACFMTSTRPSSAVSNHAPSAVATPDSMRLPGNIGRTAAS